MRFFLVGYMGAGKTYWGQKWAQEHELLFIDMDKEIEQKAGLTIASIFEKYGEDYFRKLEQEVLHSLADYDKCIIATGGGVPVFFDNMEWMKTNGHVIYLSATPQTLHFRLKNEVAKRPLLRQFPKNKLLTHIEESVHKRAPFYTQAHTIIDTEYVTDLSFKNILLSCRENF